MGAGAETDAEAEAEALERGRKLFAAPCEFLLSAPALGDLPEPELPEVAFAGRSNVGKSSLLNALVNRRGLARTSNTPGRTQTANFFRLGTEKGPALMLVDLPGYGYARASKVLVEEWTRLIEDYLRGRPNLRRVCLLVDARHGLKDSDRTLMALLDEAAVSYQAVLTKVDKLKGGALEERLGGLAAELAGHGAAHPEQIATSAAKSIGIGELRAALAAFAAPA